MGFDFVFKKLEPTEAIKTHLKEKLSRLERFLPKDFDIHVTLKVEKLIHEVEIICHYKNNHFISSGRTEDLYKSIDEAITNLENQIRKNKDHHKNHHT